MARAKGSKDKDKRVRRKSTDAEKNSRKTKKARIAQQNAERARARARATFFNSSAPADQTPREPEIQYKEVLAHECNGTADLGEMEAVFDDNYDMEDDGACDGAMQEYMKALMKRYMMEDSMDFKKTRPEDTEWLQEFLRNHGYWIRGECAPFLCKMLHIQFHEQAYYRDIRLWFPDVEGGVACMPTCITCKSNMNVRPHSYPTHHPGRRVVTFDSHYYIMSRQYLCKCCQEKHQSQKDKANGRPFEKVQYTMMGSHNEVLKYLPTDMYYKFPAVLSHRAGLHRSLARSLRPLMDKGLRSDGISDWLLELHSLNYMNEYISHELRLERQRAFTPGLTRPMFSKFDDREKYNGAAPSGAYLAQVYKKELEDIRPHFDREMKKVSVDQFSIDASAKAPKKLTQHNGKRLYEALQSGMNEIGQFRTQVLAGSDAHEQLEPALNAMEQTLKEHGKHGPRVAFSDNPHRDKKFLMETFESLQKSQEDLDQIAAQLNASSPSPNTTDTTPHALSNDDDDDNVAPQQPDNGLDPATQTGISNDDNGLLKRIQVVSSQDINSKVDALWEQVQDASPDGSGVFSFDIEWDTVQSHGSERRHKVGKVPLLTIGYKLDDEIYALLFKMPTKFPRRLLAFLRNPKFLFVGFSIKNDFDILSKDFELPGLSQEVNHLSLGMFARKRDIVQSGNCSMALVIELVLGETLDKSDDVRCSKWSSSVYSRRQILYAGLDVIKPLEAYEKLSQLPDLSQRIDPDNALPGLNIDIVPPHARNDQHKPVRGYRVGDLATRAAIGTIVDDEKVTNPANITPLHVKSTGKTRVVKVTEVLAPSLIVPGHFVGNGKNKKPACLRDFETPFRIVLPLTMMRGHVASELVRTYEPRVTLVPTRRRITPPAPARRCTDSMMAKTNADPTTTETEVEMHGECLGAVYDICEDGDSNDDDVFDSELFDLTQNDDGDDPLCEDAEKEIRQEHLDTIFAAELAAEMAQNEGKVDLLYCDDLDAPPDLIVQVFSCVLGDIFHAMNRAKVPVKHEYKKAYFNALMKAFLLWDERRLNEVIEKLQDNGWTDDDIQSALYFRPGFFRNRVERIALPPRELYWRVRAVFVTFGSKIDSKTEKPLFNKAAWIKANNLLKEILLGYYSDPPGFNFYRLRLGTDGKPTVDKYGLQLLHCNRGTNDVENGHKHYHTTFRYTAGIELGDCLLAERRHRHNLRMAETRIADHPRLGHFNTWQIDKLQILVEKNHGVLLFPTWVNASDFLDTDESFVTVAIHSEELDKALKGRAAQISDEVKNSYSGDLRFMCHQQGIPIPFLPVDGKDEYKLFTRLLLFELKRFDENEMALKWIDFVDGVTIFPKLPHQLRKYHKHWERNHRVQNAVENMKSELDMLDALNKEHVPSDLAIEESGGDSDDVMVSHDDDIVDTVEPGGLLSFPRAYLPPAMVPPTIQALRPAYERDGLFVGFDRIGENVIPEELPPLLRFQGNRGPDVKKRQIRRCRLCLRHGQSNTAKECRGRNKRKDCPYFNEDGSSKNQLTN
jgi:hypothetical protein